MLELPLPGQLVAGKYLAREELGRGGMGRVIAAHHLSLDRPVALKFLSSSDVDELALERFLREARAAAQIESEHVARVMDAARLESGTPYIVMEHLTGTNLKQLLAQGGRLSVDVAVDYVLQACDAMAEAHARGIVHRDLKPSNLFLCDRADGVRLIKVLDFGISKVRRDADVGGAETTSAELILGSPQYMAPEQVRSAKYADARSDIWSLGAITYELLAGQPAHRAETLPGLLASIVADEPCPLSELRDDVPVGLQGAVRRCLAKDPRARFQSVAELARALAPFAPPVCAALVERISRISGESDPAPPPGAVSGSRGPRSAATRVRLAVLGALVVLLAGAAVLVRRDAPLVEPAAPVPVANDRVAAAPNLPSQFLPAGEPDRRVAEASPAPLERPQTRETPRRSRPSPNARGARAVQPPSAAEPLPSSPERPPAASEPEAELPQPEEPTPAAPERARDPLDVFSDPR